jgi:YebC/PmpR family DNA-binding regulatory protein
MGRIFETRKATMFARWDRMAKAFTRINRDLAIAAKSGGANPENNPSLRRIIQNARAVNMPKDKIDATLKRLAGDGGASYEEVLYEGYAPHGIALLVVTATDNPTRTVANIRYYFNRGNGNLGNAGSVGFMFKHMGVFRLKPEGINQDELELDLIDYGLEDMGETTDENGKPQLVVRCSFQDFGQMQTAIEARKLAIISAESEYIASNLNTLSEEQATEVLKLVDALEQDDDVQKVFHNLA